MKVSIITVVFNGAQTLRDCIESVLGQTYSNLEYIIIDGGSTDGTVALVESFGSKIDRFISEKDNGIYDAMNKGIEIATGDLIGILNADDYYAHHKVISKVVATLGQADAVYGDLLYVDAENPTTIRRYWKSGGYSPKKFLYGWMPPHPTFFLRKASYEQFGGYRLDLGTAADYELMLRMLYKHRLKVNYLSEVLTIMRTGGASNRQVANRVKANQSDRQAWVLNDIKPYWFTLWLKPLRKILQFYNRPK